MVFAYSISDDKNYCDVTQVDLNPRLPVGTRLVKEDFIVYHYARAGEDLQKEVFVEPGLSDEDRVTLAFSRKMEKFADIVYGKVVAAIGDPRNKPGILGWSVVEVKKGYYFWIREIPLGATLIKEGEMAGEEGFEPSLRDPESRVLPLDDSPKTDLTQSKSSPLARLLNDMLPSISERRLDNK